VSGARRGACVAFAAWTALAAPACSAPSPDARFVATPPDRATFPPVAEELVHRCGTLDCHGSSSRNLRIYGSTGLRLDPGDRPSATQASTPAEIDRDFDGIVGLEPEILSEVIASGGAAPERLTLVRKARGGEEHKGGAPFTAGDDQDKCLTSWLAGHADADACARALALPIP